MTKFLKCIPILFLALLISCAANKAKNPIKEVPAKTNLPSISRADEKDPTGRYTISYRKINEDWENCQVVLNDLKTEKSYEVMRYPGDQGDFSENVSVSWSPNGKAFFVNYRAGSNYNGGELFSPTALNKIFKYNVNLPISEEKQKTIDHYYFSFAGWKNANTVIIGIAGNYYINNDRRVEFEAEYEYILDGKTKLLSYKDDTQEQHEQHLKNQK